MACINKTLPEYKKLVAIYQDALAEKIVRSYSKGVKKLKDDFYYPTQNEIKDWVTRDKYAIYSTVVDALTVNPNLSEQGIASFLKGVVNRYQGTFFITKGDIYSTLTLRQEFIETMFKPNYNIMLELEKKFPDVFKIKDTKDKYTKIVEITPRQEKAVQGELFFQTENIFATMSKIEKDLKDINKTPQSIGSDIKLDSLLKKAGLNSELRSQFMQLLQKYPELKKVKISNILSTYIKQLTKDSDKAYYKAIEQPLSTELEKTLTDYFSKFKIRKQELDNLKDKFGVDSVGVFDVLAKTVYYSKNRNLLTLPEEYGHVFVELLGSISARKAKNPLFTYLFDNIEKWNGYQRVFDSYKNIYVTAEGNIDIYKIKKEAIGQAIGIALVSNFKNNKAADKSIWNILFNQDKDFWTKIQEVIDYISELLKGIDYVNINVEIDKIAKDILNKNYDKLDRLQKDTSDYNLLSYGETIETQNKKDGGLALGFMKWFSDLGNIITGSLAYRQQGTTYRPEIDALHDIDMIVPSDIHKISLNKSDYLSPEEIENDKLYRKYITEGDYKNARKYKTAGNIKLSMDDMENQDYFKKIKQKYPDLDFLYTFFNQKANAYYITVNAIWSKDQKLKDKFKSLTGNFNDRLQNFTKEELDQMYLFDFFLRPETSQEYVKSEDKQYGLNLAHFNYAFYEKLNMMGRAKDAYDYQMWDYFDEKNILAPDFSDRLVYFQINQSQIEAERINQLEQKIKTTGVSPSELAELNKLKKATKVQQAAPREVYVTYAPKGKERQAYKVVGSKIFNKQNVEVFKQDSVDRNKIFANVAVKEKRAKVVEYRGNQYIVNNRKQILSVATGKIMQWPDNNGDRLAIINLAFMPATAKPESLATQQKVVDEVQPGIVITPGDIVSIYNSRNQNLGSRRPMSGPEFMKIANDFINLMRKTGKSKFEILEQLKCI